MERFAVLWFWEHRINHMLAEEGLHFDKLICIKKTPQAYIGFFTVNSDKIFGKLIVKYSGKNLFLSLPYLIKREQVGMIKIIDKEELIIDNREEFDWISMYS